MHDHRSLNWDGRGGLQTLCEQLLSAVALIEGLRESFLYLRPGAVKDL